MSKFVAICEAQGGFRRPEAAAFQHVIECERAGRITSVDNRRLARLAKLAGAPRAPAAGVELHVNIGDPVEAGQPLARIETERCFKE